MVLKPPKERTNHYDDVVLLFYVTNDSQLDVEMTIEVDSHMGNTVCCVLCVCVRCVCPVCCVCIYVRAKKAKGSADVCEIPG